MNKKFSYILMCLCMLGILLAPFSPLLQIRNQALSVSLAENAAHAQATPPAGTTGASNGLKSTLYQNIGDCGVFGQQSSITGCFVVLAYYIFVSIPSWLMGLTAELFDFMASLTLSDVLYRAGFIQTMWQLVRDFANIFFILILLYAAFAIILGLGHGGGKRIVGMVIIVALLVNFSLFFAKVVIDSSNIVALIFYNKISCLQKDGVTPCKYTPTTDATKTDVPEKDLALALASAFDVNSFYNGNFFKGLPASDLATTTSIGTDLIAAGIGAFNPGAGAGYVASNASTQLDNGFAIALIVTYGIVAYALAWIFLIVGLAFLGRILMLMLLMVVSPFAFVTAATPGLSRVSIIGWENWLSQLISVSFSAAVFMAILFLAAQILAAQVFTNYSVGNAAGLTGRLIVLFAPALLIVIMLWKGKDYAIKASGVFTGAIMSAAGAIASTTAGVALALATDGASVGLQASAGSASRKVANSESLRKTATDGKGFSKYAARMTLAAADYGQKASFDVRHTQLGKAASKASGVNPNNAAVKFLGLGTDTTKGGIKGYTDRLTEKKQERMKTYELTKDGAFKQDRRNAEYNNDKNTAEEKLKGENNARTAQWERDRDAAVEKTRTEKGGLTNTEEAAAKREFEQKTSKPVQATFDEKKFKDAYVTGNKELLKTFGVDKEKEYRERGIQEPFRGGSVGDSKTVNAERREAYASSLEKEGYDKELVANIRKGVDPHKHLIHELSEALGHGDEEHAAEALHHAAASAPKENPSGGDGGGGNHGGGHT